MRTISFYLNGENVVIDFEKEHQLRPLTPVLDYLRNHKNLKGTKEGCGEGDCGACTICIAESKEIFHAVNSCILPLPELEGKHVYTIEWLNKEEKHPIVEAMIEKRGSQCGFCSPGMIMSAYAHYRNHKPFTREEIEKSLSGNLCRCTGYESILNAMLYIGELPYKEEKEMEFEDKKDNEDFIYDKEYKYIKTNKLENALKYKETYRDAVIISGATDVEVLLKKKKITSKTYIDISDIKTIKKCMEEGENIYIGAGTSIESFRNYIYKYYPQTDDYLKSFASLQIRNRGSLGGNIGGSSPVGDIMPLLLALDAEFELISIKGKRTVKATDFITSYRKNVLESNELIFNIIIPKPSQDYFLFCHKQSKRKDMDISTLSFCIYCEIKNKIIKKVYTGFGGMAAIPKGSCSGEEYLIEKEINLENFIKAGEIASKDFSPLSDVRGSAENRLFVLKNLFIKTYLKYESSRNKNL